MNEFRVTEWVDIQAPKQEVFNLILNIQRRLQLSPLWGFAAIEQIDEDYPQPGSQYQTRAGEQSSPPYTSIITILEPERKLAYKTIVAGHQKNLDGEEIQSFETGQAGAEMQPIAEIHVTWAIQDSAQGTRLTYVEEYSLSLAATSADNQEFTENVRKVIKDWLNNIKRYTELRNTRFQRFLRKMMDRYYLNMRPDQRRTVQIILFMHSMGFISFVMAALAMGVASLVK